MFLTILEVIPPTSQHFRNAISRNCNTAQLLLRFWGATPWVIGAIQKLMFRKLLFSLAVTCNASRILLANVSLQRPTFRHLRFSMFRNTPCLRVSILQSALPLSTFAFRSRGLGPPPLGSHCFPLARASLGPPGTPQELMCLPVPGSQATFQANEGCRYIPHHTRALD